MTGAVAFVTTGGVVSTGGPLNVRGELQLRYAPVFVWESCVAVRVTHYRDVDEGRAAAERLAASKE